MGGRGRGREEGKRERGGRQWVFQGLWDGGDKSSPLLAEEEAGPRLEEAEL